MPIAHAAGVASSVSQGSPTYPEDMIVEAMRLAADGMSLEDFVRRFPSFQRFLPSSSLGRDDLAALPPIGRYTAQMRFYSVFWREDIESQEV